MSLSIDREGEEGLDESVRRWIGFAKQAAPAIGTPASLGFVPDEKLRTMISRHMKKKSPSPKLPIPRSLLCDLALRLNLISTEDACAKAPEKRRRTKMTEVRAESFRSVRP